MYFFKTFFSFNANNSNGQYFERSSTITLANAKRYGTSRCRH